MPARQTSRPLLRHQTCNRIRAGDIELPIPSNKDNFFLPGTQPHTLVDTIPATTSCQVCHSEPIYGAYRGSMMAQAGRDPLFWSALAVANNDAVGAGDYCLRCHMPKGWLEGRSDQADGSGMLAEDIDAGVACEVCHRMVDPVPGAQDETTDLDIAIRAALTSTVPIDHAGSAMIIVDPNDNRRGPFALPGFGFHTAFQSNFQNQGIDAVAASRLCGSCHNVDNPLLVWTENPPNGGPAQYWPNTLGEQAPSFESGDIFPLERTYDEWLASTYAQGCVFATQFAGAKPDGIVESCQDCHMERQIGEGAQSFLNPTYRDCVTTGCLPAHTFIGGNAWIPEILQDSRWRLYNETDAPYLQETVKSARSLLQRAATVTASIETDGNSKTAVVRVINETGQYYTTATPKVAACG
ncbi:MAG: multiheme c-type cytochrome [Chloroflexota bacterium]